MVHFKILEIWVMSFKSRQENLANLLLPPSEVLTSTNSQLRRMIPRFNKDAFK